MAILNRAKKLCFIHINRTGGTTVRYVLNRHIGLNLIVGKEHGTIKECLELHPEIIDYYKFSFVRQPYDWLLSLYYDIRMESSIHPDYKIVSKLDFYHFLQWIEDIGMKRKEGKLPIYRTQSQYLFMDDNLMVDDVYKYEELCDDTETSNIRDIFNKFELTQPVHIPVKMRSDRPLSPINSLSIQEIKLVNRLFAEDFKNFKYFKYE